MAENVPSARAPLYPVRLLVDVLAWRVAGGGGAKYHGPQDGVCARFLAPSETFALVGGDARTAVVGDARGALWRVPAGFVVPDGGRAA